MAELKNLHNVLVIVAGAILSITSHKLTFFGAIAAAGVGLLVFAGAGYTGFIMLAMFFVLGSLTTSWEKENKSQQRGRLTGICRRRIYQFHHAGYVLRALYFDYKLGKGKEKPFQIKIG